MEVRYGHGSRKNANQVADLLRKNAVSYIRIGEAEGEHPVTQVFSITDNTEAAVRVAEAITAREVLLDAEVGADVDVVVILGKDMLP